MSRKTINIIIITCLLLSANTKAEGIGKDSKIQVYLPREITLKDSVINLGKVSIIRGEELLVKKAGEIQLGQISLPGQEIIIDKATVLSRLACNGIPSSKVTLTGAEKVSVRRQHRVIKGSEFVETALNFAKTKYSDDSICEFNPTRTPQDLVIPGPSKNIRLLSHFAKSRIKNQIKVCIATLSDGQEVGTREVILLLKYNCHRAITQVDIPAGAVISPENIRIEKTISNRPEPDNWAVPYGLVARRQLAANTVIQPDMVGPFKPPVLLKRNQNVVIKINRPGLSVTATGKTIQLARAGEYIKVQNADSHRIILCKVNKDGTVEPVF